MYYFGRLSGFGLGDAIFTDGSCSSERVPELNRAGYGIVMIDAQGNRTACAIGAVPAGLPQTPQAAESLGAVKGVALLSRGAKVYGDCKNIVNNLERVRSGTALHGAYGPQFKAIRDESICCHIQASIWTKAHRQEQLVEDSDDLLLFKGNQAADAAAGEAVKQFHHCLSKQERAMLGQQITRAKSMVLLASAVWSLWPSPPKCSMPGSRKCKKTVSPELLFCDHRFRPIGPGGVRACKDCWKIYSPALACKECKGIPEVAKKHAANPHGHGAVLLVGTRHPFLLCVRCGLWTEKRLVGLDKPCRGKLQGIGVGNVVRLIKGLHPHRNEAMKVEDTTRKALRVGLEWARARGA